MKIIYCYIYFGPKPGAKWTLWAYFIGNSKTTE